LAIRNDVSAETAEYICKCHPAISFDFRPSFNAFQLEPIYPLAVRLFKDATDGKRDFLTAVLFDVGLVGFLTKAGGPAVIAKFLKIQARDQGRLMHQMGRFPFRVNWPGPLQETISNVSIPDV
jgi:hypothetical protein